jgi:hypothetical protein
MVSAPTKANANKTNQPVNKAGQNPNVAKQIQVKNNSKNQNEQAADKRETGVSLAGKMGEGLQNATSAATIAGGEVVKESLKGGLTQALANFVGPVRFMIMSNPVGMMAARPLVKFLTPKLEEYLAANQIDLPVKPSAVLNQLLFGDLEDLDGEVSKALDGFIEKALPANVKDAIQSGSITKIATITGSSITSGAKDFLSQMFSMPNSNKFTSLFKFMGAKIPFINKLSPRFQPWAAGAGVLMFGGAILRLAVKFAKLAFAGGVLAAGGAFFSKMFKKMSSGGAGAGAAMPGSAGGAGGLMNALGSLAGGGGGALPSHSGMPGAGVKPGMGDMIKSASSLMNMIGGKK